MSSRPTLTGSALCVMIHLRFIWPMAPFTGMGLGVDRVPAQTNSQVRMCLLYLMATLYRFKTSVQATVSRIQAVFTLRECVLLIIYQNRLGLLVAISFPRFFLTSANSLVIWLAGTVLWFWANPF